MAGYMTKLQGYVYEGEYKAATGTALANGMFATVSAGEVIPAGGTLDTILRIVRPTLLWGLPAVEVVVESVGTDDVYFVEQITDPNIVGAYSEATQTIKPGEYVRMHRLLPGEMAIFSITSNLVASFLANVLLKPAATGVAAVYTP